MSAFARCRHSLGAGKQAKGAKNHVLCNSHNGRIVFRWGRSLSLGCPFVNTLSVCKYGDCLCEYVGRLCEYVGWLCEYVVCL